MDFNPTMIEGVITAVMTLLAGGAGYGIRRGRSDAKAEAERDRISELTQQLTKLASEQANTQRQLTQAVATLDRLVTVDLDRMEARVSAMERKSQRLTADVDGNADAIDILVTQLDEHISESAQQSIAGKLHRQRRHEVTSVNVRSRG